MGPQKVKHKKLKRAGGIDLEFQLFWGCAQAAHKLKVSVINFIRLSPNKQRTGDIVS